MGLLDRLGFGKDRLDFLTSPAMSVASPFADNSSLSQIIVSDLFAHEGGSGLENLPLSREEAMTIPAVNKARSVLISTITAFPLKAYAAGTAEPLATQPTFLQRDDGPQSPLYRMTMTVDDLLFFGRSLWLVERGADNQITAAEWLPQKHWQITEGAVTVRDNAISETDYILFEIPGYPGLLNIGSRTLRHARNLEIDIDQKTRNHIPATVITLPDSVERTEEEERAILESWKKARRDPEGAVALLPEGVTVNFHGDVKTDLLVEGRNAVVTNVGQLTSIRSAMLDGTSSIDSLTYTTAQGERNAFYEFDLPFWIAPIEARLSQVVPRGQRVRFDKYESQNLPTPTGPVTED